MYRLITAENPYEEPMRIYPAPHYTMGGLWVDYNLMSTIPGLFVIGEANFSDHGANRLGASAVMQGLADGYFVLPNTISNYLANEKLSKVPDDSPEALGVLREKQDEVNKLLAIKGKKSADVFHRELGNIMWDKCGMARNEQGLKEALKKIPELREEFWSNVSVSGSNEGLNQAIERAGRVADFLEYGELMCLDALTRTESCGGHFREESQTEEGEAKRDDQNFAFVSAWEYKGKNTAPVLHKEQLNFENVKLAERSYK
jgi:succinate dehydrogenase / fumarate reductase flavoprotein subunit